MKEFFGCFGIIILIATLREIFLNFGFLGIVSLAVPCVIIGIIIKVTQALEKKTQQRELENFELLKEAEAKNSQQRKAYASEFKTKIYEVTRRCEENLNNCKRNALTPTYESIYKQKEMWTTLGKIFLNVEKIESMATEFNLNEYKNKLEELKTITQENIASLEAKEKEICEQALDCEVIAGEHKYALENLLSEARKISCSKDEISKEEKDMGVEKLEIIGKESNIEYEELQATYSLSKFKEYSNSVSEQQSIIENIKQNITALDKHNLDIEQFIREST